ncbi:putative pilus system protein FilF [Acinetobacter venetianus]|uniref:putative pilus system protein FilF n=1 Tax=Acinetobacter venetianus TaxID=52133 RepID=UPI00037E8C62|nr:hypothetical protein [Acinetobacter venetianus]
MNKKIILTFALSTFAALLTGCGGESAKINEDPTQGVDGVTSNTSCNTTDSECLQFVFDYPAAGINFDCSTDRYNHFATKLEGNIVTGACKLGDEATFYIQGTDARRISLGKIKLDTIAKLKTTTVPHIRVIDFAMALTEKSPSSLNANDETIRVAMAIVKILQSMGIERNDNIAGELQPTEFTEEKKDQLNILAKDIGVNELLSGEYVSILQPWLDVSKVSDAQAFNMVVQLLNLVNTGIWQAELPTYKAGGGSTSSDNNLRPDGFFGCNKTPSSKCIEASSDLLHSMGSFFLLSDRQGYTIGNGQQWKGPATTSDNIVVAPIALITKVKPAKLQIDAQSSWLNPITQQINTTTPLRLKLTENNPAEDLLINQGKLMNRNTIAGTENIYRQLIKAKDSDVIDTSHFGTWKQTIASTNYNGTVDIVKVNPSSYLSKDIFRTEKNVASQQNYIFPLYATLTFNFSTEAKLSPVSLGVVIDENGDIRSDIKADSTSTDMSGVCGTVKSINADGTITDNNDQVQYRIGTTGATLFSTNDKSISVRMLFSNPKFGLIDGASFGLNLTSGTGAKINIHNLLSGQVTGINLTNFSNNTVVWSNTYAYYTDVYNRLYDDLKTEDKNKYVAPTDAERELAKRFSGTVSIKIADQNIPACKAIKTKS